MRYILLFILTLPAFPQMLQGIVGGGSASVATSITLSHNWVATCADATTCTVTATGGVAAGSLVTVQVMASNPINVISLSAGGTLIDANIRSGINIRRYLSGGYILSADAVGSGTITATFSATSGGATVNIREYTYSGGTIALDAVGDLSTNTGVGNPIVGIPLTLSGAKDVVVEQVSAHTSTPSAVSSPWADALFGSAYGFANQVGVTSFTAPDWTQTGATYASRAAMAFGFGVTTCTPDMMLDFTGTSGTAPTAATLTANTYGDMGRGDPAITSGRSSYWTVTNASTYLLYNTAASHALGSAAPRHCGGGVTYPNSTGGISLDTTGGASARSAKWFMPWSVDIKYTTLAASAWVKTTITADETLNVDSLSVAGTGGSGGVSFANAILRVASGSLNFFLEGATGSGVNVSTGTWYKLDVSYTVSGDAKMMIRDESGAQVGSTVITPAQTGGYLTNASFGDVNGAAKTAGKLIYWDKVRICYTNCTWPLPL